MMGSSEIYRVGICPVCPRDAFFCAEYVLGSLRTLHPPFHTSNTTGSGQLRRVGSIPCSSVLVPFPPLPAAAIPLPMQATCLFTHRSSATESNRPAGYGSSRCAFRWFPPFAIIYIKKECHEAPVCYQHTQQLSLLAVYTYHSNLNSRLFASNGAKGGGGGVTICHGCFDHSESWICSRYRRGHVAFLS
jgi:hypothetical protein